MTRHEWLAQFKVGQVWLCREHMYIARVTAIYDDDIRCSVILRNAGDESLMADDIKYRFRPSMPTYASRNGFGVDSDAKKDPLGLINLIYSP